MILQGLGSRVGNASVETRDFCTRKKNLATQLVKLPRLQFEGHLFDLN